MRTQIPSGLLTAFRRAAILLLLMAAAVVLVFGDYRAVAAITTADPSARSLAATGDVAIGHAGVLNDLVRTV